MPRSSSPVRRKEGGADRPMTGRASGAPASPAERSEGGGKRRYCDGPHFRARARRSRAKPSAVSRTTRLAEVVATPARTAAARARAASTSSASLAATARGTSPAGRLTSASASAVFAATPPPRRTWADTPPPCRWAPIVIDEGGRPRYQPKRTTPSPASSWAGTWSSPVTDAPRQSTSISRIGAG